MAFGEAPQRTLIHIPQGLWRRPLWEGIELRAAYIALIILIVGFATKWYVSAGIFTFIAMAWFYVFRIAAEKDPDAFGVALQNRDLHGISHMPATRTIDTRTYRLPRINR